MPYPIPHLNLNLAKPGKVTLPSVVGGGVEGGLSQSGIDSVVDFTGGGYVTVKYSQMALGNARPAALRYMSYLAAILNGGVRSVYVPLLTDFIEPALPGVSLHSNGFADEVQFTDGTQFTDNATRGTVTQGDAALNAGTLAITMQTPIPGLSGGEWFSIFHPTKGWRAYCVTDIDSFTTTDDSGTYTVGIRPTLRAAVPNGTAINFTRPLCTMRLAPGSAIVVDVDVGWLASPEISFIESFGQGY